MSVLVFAGAAVAGDETAKAGEASAATAEQAPYSDAMFFEKAAIGGMAEVDAGKLAQAKGASDEVRSFGQRMVTDHSQKNEDTLIPAGSHVID